MRILVTTDAVGGVWRYSLTLARQWARSGVAVELAVCGPAPDTAQWQEAAAIPGLILHRTELALDWTAPDAAGLERIADETAELADALGVDSVHLHAPAAVGRATSWPVPVVAVMHSCLLTWWRAMRAGPPPDEFVWRIEATRAGLRRADHVVAPSRAFRDAILSAYGEARIIAIPNGRQRPAVVPTSVRRRAVLAAGRFWDEAKDAATLDSAAGLLDAPVEAAGSFHGPNGQTAGSQHLVRLGSLDEDGMARALGNATVFASTARYEPFGLAVLEAAQCGLALVLCDIPTLRELWNGAALFVPPGDAAGFAAAMTRALDQPGPLATAARARADRYSDSAMAAATLELHRAATPSRRSS